MIQRVIEPTAMGLVGCVRAVKSVLVGEYLPRLEHSGGSVYECTSKSRCRDSIQYHRYVEMMINTVRPVLMPP